MVCEAVGVDAVENVAVGDDGFRVGNIAIGDDGRLRLWFPPRSFELLA